MGHLSGLANLKKLRLTESISKLETPQSLWEVFVRSPYAECWWWRSQRTYVLYVRLS